jgi:CDP-diacylglycerol--glycerol-3-phosphate 3-phosphatidyltransferase
MNLPNKLTLLRVCLIPFFVVFAKMGGFGMQLAAVAVYILACVTDALDGHIARSRNLVTNFGKFADPLADKMLTTAAFLYLQEEGVCDPAVLIIILAREFAVSGLRMLAAGSTEKLVIPANIWGKLKTAGMMVTISAFYFGSALWPTGAALRGVTGVLCWLCAAVTLFSGITYFSAAGALFPEDNK